MAKIKFNENFQPESNIGFKLLDKDDLPLLHKWLNNRHVKRWYETDIDLTTFESVSELYAPALDGTDPTESYVIFVDEHPVGYIQTYLIKDYPFYSQHIDAKEEAAGLDVFIGDADYVHRGLGAGIIKKFLRDMVFVNPEIKSCIVGPEPKNIAAIKAYEKAGFAYFKTIQLPDEPEQEYLMRAVVKQ